MKKEDLTKLLVNAESQDTIDFLEDVISFVSEIKPVLDKINSSVKANLDKVPGASEKLNKVTEATELATNDILNVLEGMNDKIMEVLSALEKQKQEQYKIFDRIKAFAENRDFDSIIDVCENRKSNEESSLISQYEETLNSMMNDTTSIMISLQVQDITAQQLAGVNHILSLMQQRLNTILSNFENTGLSELITDIIEDDESEQLHFDPEAVDALLNKAGRQESIDGIIENMGNQNDEDDSGEMIDNDDIDKLFSGSS